MSLPIRNIYCLGRNYAKHAIEMGNDPSARPLIFMKPASAVIGPGEAVVLPFDCGEAHHEVELALQLKGPARRIAAEDAAPLIGAYAVAIDMTLRALQAELKKAGRPWEIAKAFETSCPLGPWVAAEEVSDADALDIGLTVNGEERQAGNTRQMMVSTAGAVAYLSQFFYLRAGDVILTGTPDGVGPVVPGDVMRARIEGLGELEVRVEREAA